MTVSEIIIALTIHLIIPLAGLLLYFLLVLKMRREKVANPPEIDFLILFATYGGMLLTILTSFFWIWSGMASLGLFYLIFAAPIILGIIAYRNFKKRKILKYHLWAYRKALLYYVHMPIALLIGINFGT